MTLINVLNRVWLAAIPMCVLPMSLMAAEVKVTGAHLCCGACVKGVSKALDGVNGVSSVACDRETETISFSAADASSAQSGIQALADAGFGGSAKVDGKATAYPATGAKAGVTADTVTFSGVHLCCGGCITAARDAVADVNGVMEVEVDRDSRSVKLIGKGIDQQTAAEALMASGFFGKVNSTK